MTSTPFPPIAWRHADIDALRPPLDDRSRRILEAFQIPNDVINAGNCITATEIEAMKKEIDHGD